MRRGVLTTTISCGAVAAACLAAASPRAQADQVGPARVVAPAGGGYYDALSGSTVSAGRRARFAVRPGRLAFHVLGVGVSTTMTGLRWSGWGTGHATARGEARFCPDIGPCRTFSGVLIELRAQRRLVCTRRRGDWITHYVRMTARLSPSGAASRLRLETPSSLSC